MDKSASSMQSDGTGKGALDGVRVLKTDTVKLFTEVLGFSIAEQIMTIPIRPIARGPNLSSASPMPGLRNPPIPRATVIATETSVRPHPNSCCSGSKNGPME